MNKKFKASIFIISTCFVIFFLLPGLYIFLELNQNFPESTNEFEMQGVVWSSAAYYYHPLIYTQEYNPIADASIIGRAKNMGVNWVMIKVMYNGSETGEIIGDDPQAEFFIQQAVSMAHQNGLKVFLVPFVDSYDYWVIKRWNLNSETWSPYVIKWAKFAEDNDVEMFAPGVEMNLILDDTSTWLQQILPKIKAVYSGKVATAEHPYLHVWPDLVENNSFDGYDCIGIALYPFKHNEETDTNDIATLVEYEEEIEEKATFVDEAAQKANISCKIVVPLGMDYWQGAGEPDEITRAIAYSKALDILAQHKFSGVFLHKWSSEPGNWLLTEEVGNMLQTRWIK